MEIKIGDRIIGEGHPVFIIAEMSANHLQDFDRAVAIIKAAKDAGADAIKLQTYTPDTMTIDCDNDFFIISQGTVWDGKTFYDLYKEAYTPWEWHKPLQKIAEDEGLIFFSTPFDKTAVDLLEDIDVPAYKIASFEITDIPLIEYVASKGKPMIISTGIATLCDIEEAVNACRRMGNDQVILLKCTSSYPAPVDGMNLATIPNIRDTFNVISGLSDHTLTTTLPVCATALGAKVVEKHLTLNRDNGGPDAAFSLEPEEFGAMTKAIRVAELATGKITYELSESGHKNREFCRSLFVVNDIKAGECFTEENVRSIRPGYGLPPKYLKDVLGKRAKVDIKKGIPMEIKYLNEK